IMWRAFRNRRQIGGLLGFAPAKYDSGESSRDQGITRAGNTRLQSVMVPLAWGWVHWQRQSALTQWSQERFGRGKRARKVGIIALPRKLLIALWRYATDGVVPTGAVLKAAAEVDDRRHTRAVRTVCTGFAKGDRHEDGTTAVVFGSRLNRLRGPRRTRA